MRKRWKALHSALTDLDRRTDAIDRRTEKVETILLVRDPGASSAADAYDGLRRQVVASVAERLAHLAQLAEFAAALEHGADTETLGKLVQEWMSQAGLERVEDPRHPEAVHLYELIEEHGGDLEVLKPAYVDGITGRVIRQGRAARPAPEGAADRPVPGDAMEKRA